jgi:site-specific DNA-methyltransferase (adenine-specific)
VTNDPTQQGGFWQEPALPKGYHAVKPPSKTEDWATPGWLFRRLHREFDFTIDVAAAAHNTKCPRYYTIEQNGLEQSWAGERVWANPPWDHKNLTAFTTKAVREKDDHGVLSVFLVPVKSDQGWFHRNVIPHEVRLIEGRIEFIPVAGDASNAPLPACIVVISPRHGSKMISLKQTQGSLLDTVGE